MARRDTARLAGMSDPERNWNWWRFIPPPPERKTPGAPTPGAISKTSTSAADYNANITAEEARRAAERLFERTAA